MSSDAVPPDWLERRETQVRPLELRRLGTSVEPGPEAAAEPEPVEEPEPVAVAAVAEPPAELLAQLEERMREFVQATLEHACARDQAFRQIEGELIELAVAIASEIVEQQLQLEPQLHVALAQAACRALGVEGRVTLRASKEAYETIVKEVGGGSLDVDGVAVELELDAELEGLGCVVEDEHSQVDGRVGERLRSVYRALEEERRRRGRQTA
ncbi:MAG: hypothetical protein MJD61_18465 [Proteobacteria bacterium]|nr:hypothetical protein [Pseudomonadota bacterium]